MATYRGLFRGRELKGRDWVKTLPAEERKIWASLGRMALSFADKNWHALGGRKRAQKGLRDSRGRYTLARAGAGGPTDALGDATRPTEGQEGVNTHPGGAGVDPRSA